MKIEESLVLSCMYQGTHYKHTYITFVYHQMYTLVLAKKKLITLLYIICMYSVCVHSLLKIEAPSQHLLFNKNVGTRSFYWSHCLFSFTFIHLFNLLYTVISSIKVLPNSSEAPKLLCCFSNGFCAQKSQSFTFKPLPITDATAISI